MEQHLCNYIIQDQPNYKVEKKVKIREKKINKNNQIIVRKKKFSYFK